MSLASERAAWPGPVLVIMVLGVAISLSTRAPALPAAPTSDPATWSIDRVYAFLTDGEPRGRHMRALIDSLASPAGPGQPMTKAEFFALIERPEAKEVYASQLIKYATPKSIEIQDDSHEKRYRSLMTESKLKAGVDFMRQNESPLAEAERRYGVARKDIVSILMWESALGRFTGDYRVFNIFMGQLLFLELARERAVADLVASGEADSTVSRTLTVREIRRFARIKERAVRNLAVLLRMSRSEGSDPLEMRGSWGGAIGYVQFMPYRLDVAADGDGDGKIDLYSWPDAIMSVASYLHILGDYGKSEKSRRRAVFRYNPSRSYVDGVIAYADAIWKRYR